MSRLGLSSGVCMLAVLLGFVRSAEAAEFTVRTVGHSEVGAVLVTPGEPWQPRPGLFAVKSEETDYLFQQTIGNFTAHGEGNARAAAYGSDSSVQGGVLDPRMDGFAVEPMADVMAQGAISCSRAGLPNVCSTGFEVIAFATASVNHRIVPRDPSVMPVPPTERVPVLLSFSLAASSITGPVGTAALGYSFAGFTISQGEDTLFGRRACSSLSQGITCSAVGELIGTWRAGLNYSDVTREAIYTIDVGARAEANLGGGVADAMYVESQAVADPFLYVDPTWEFASYFMVQQEAVLHPGEWIEVSRAWTMPVPEPGSWALVLAGLSFIAGVSRLRGRGARITGRA